MSGRVAIRILALAGALLAGSVAFALDPALDVSQYAHTSWRYRDGFTKGNIETIVQTSDGYLWLGTAFGLYRFDGVRAVPWQPPTGQSLPSSNVGRLLAARDGTLWMGTRNGLAGWRDGKLTQYQELAGLTIVALVEDPEGSIWVGAYGIPEGKLCEIRKGTVRCHPEMGNLGPGVLSLHEDAKGNLWVGLQTGVWRWQRGPREFFELRPLEGIQAMANGDDGGLLVSTRGAIVRLVEGRVSPFYPFPAAVRSSRASPILRDRHGGLWGATLDAGIVHWHQGRTDVFSGSDGLSGSGVSSLFEDREGSIWAGTLNGLDRFRELPAVTYSEKQGLSATPGGAVLAAKDGSVWFGSGGSALNRLDHRGVTLYQGRSALPVAGAREVVVGGLPNASVAALSEDSRGRIWLSSRTTIGYLENNRFISSVAPGGIVSALHEDSAGNMWVAYQGLGLLRLSGHNEVQRISWDTFGHRDPADTLIPDPSKGGLWLGFFQGSIAWFREGQVRVSYSAANGLGHGRVYDLRFGRDGALWAGTDGGLSRLKDDRIATLTSSNGLPCDAVQWSLEDNALSTWLMMPCGLVRIERSDLEAWTVSQNKTGQKIHPSVFDVSDGVMNRALPGSQTPNAAKSSDGKLWFWNVNGLGMIDPRRLPYNYNKVAPPVQVEQITADRKAYAAGASLPPLVRDVEIDYTALSFVEPEKMRFRYKLEGRDREWHEAGNRRQAFYDDLPPRNYRFRVMAANNSGVWNEAGAFVDFSVAPAYYQTAWYRALIAGGILALFATLYRLRLLYLKRQFDIRFEERVNERMRLARDLHDGLLQSFQGVLLKFHAVTFALPDRPAEARKSLESAIEQAREAVAEGRDAVQGLRSSVVVMNDLARAITTFGEGLASNQNGQHAPAFRVEVEGTTRDLPPILRDEVYRIAGEALRNAFRHSGARRIEVEIHYDKRQLRMRIRDDGKGIDAQILEKGARAGHHGLPGMHERARLVGGKLAVWSQAESGTEIELTIPAGLAYAKSPDAPEAVSEGRATE